MMKSKAYIRAYLSLDEEYDEEEEAKVSTQNPFSYFNAGTSLLGNVEERC